MSDWSNRLGVRILCLSGATDWVSGYYVWVEQQTWCQDIMSEWSNRLGVRILCLSHNILTPSLLLHSDTISWYPVCRSSQTQYPDTQSIAPLRHNILKPSLLLHSDIISWHPVCLLCLSGATDWVSGYYVWVEQQTGCQDIMSEWSNRLGVRILCLSGTTDWVSGYCVWLEQQT
jgi:pimeloyl-CoA synthetase